MKSIQILSLLLLLVSFSSCEQKDQGVSKVEEREEFFIYDKLRTGRVGIRTESGVLQFYDKQSNKTFTPTGYNYTHVQSLTHKGVSFTGHSTFSQEYYSADVSKKMLEKLQSGGYNTVRVFLSPAALSLEKGILDSNYLQNLSDFITQADHLGVSVIITTDLIPIAYYEKDISKEEEITWSNTQYINEEDIQLEKQFWQSLIQEFKNNGVPLKAILSYELRNEFFFHPSHKPFSDKSGLVNHPNGKVYDMAVEEDRIELVDASFLYWSTAVREAILAIDQEALVSVGFFAPGLVAKPSKVAITESTLDFVDLHMYSFVGDLTEYADYFELAAHKDKLIIMGEFGYVESKGLSIDQIKNNLFTWKNDAVANYHIDGWLLWTWTTNTGAQLSVKDENDAIFKKLSPRK